MKNFSFILHILRKIKKRWNSIQKCIFYRVSTFYLHNMEKRSSNRNRNDLQKMITFIELKNAKNEFLFNFDQ